LVDEKTFDEMISDLTRLAPMLNAYIKSKKAQKKNV